MTPCGGNSLLSDLAARVMQTIAPLFNDDVVKKQTIKLENRKRKDSSSRWLLSAHQDCRGKYSISKANASAGVFCVQQSAVSGEVAVVAAPGGDREKTAATGRLRGSLAAASMATWKPRRLLYGHDRL